MTERSLTPDDDTRSAASAMIDELAARSAGLPGSATDPGSSPPPRVAIDDARRLLDEAWVHSNAGTDVPADARMRQAKRAVLLAMRPVTSHQVQFNQQLSVAVKELAAAVDALATMAKGPQALANATAQRVQAALATIEVTVDDLVDDLERADARADDIAARVERLEQAEASDRAELRALRARQDVVLHASAAALGGKAGKRRLADLAVELDDSAELLAEDLADATRGSRAEVRADAAALLPLVDTAGGGPVLDLGFGRGEWLELLHERGVEARGVDISRRAVATASARGLDVERTDALSALAATSEASLAAVSALNLVDRLSTDHLLELVDRALVALRPGGVLLMSAANPTALDVGASEVWLDPARRRPMHPQLLELVALSRGFGETEVVWLAQPDESATLTADDLAGLGLERSAVVADRLNRVLGGPRSFAVVARKPGVALAPAP